MQCSLTGNLGTLVGPAAPRGMCRVWWDAYDEPTLQWTELLEAAAQPDEPAYSPSNKFYTVIESD